MQHDLGSEGCKVSLRTCPFLRAGICVVEHRWAQDCNATGTITLRKVIVDVDLASSNSTAELSSHRLTVESSSFPCFSLFSSETSFMSSSGPSPTSSSTSPSSTSPFSPSSARYFRFDFFTLLAFFFLALSALIAARLLSPFSCCSTLSARSCSAIFLF